ncbi:MAG: hypothetical protein KDC38_20735, partial [Planctomycetes bacterium]|nr:hypothetical protein [Planctomycetota bacterium]
VRVMDMRAITDLILEAVDEAVASSNRVFDEEERQRLLVEAEGTFQERLADMQAEKEGLLAKAHRLEEQLTRARDLLDEERKREVRADQFTLSDAGMMEMESRLERVFRRVVQGGDAPSAVESEMRAIIASLLDEERQRLAEREQAVHSEKIQLLEHKVGRLAQALHEASKERDVERRRANALEALGGGVAGIKITSHLGEDPEKGRKMELLKELIEDNRRVRSHMGEQSPAGGGRPNLMASIAGRDDSAPSGVKKIEVKRVAPPPLEVNP